MNKKRLAATAGLMAAAMLVIVPAANAVPPAVPGAAATASPTVTQGPLTSSVKKTNLTVENPASSYVTFKVEATTYDPHRSSHAFFLKPGESRQLAAINGAGGDADISLMFQAINKLNEDTGEYQKLGGTSQMFLGDGFKHGEPYYGWAVEPGKIHTVKENSSHCFPSSGTQGRAMDVQRFADIGQTSQFKISPNDLSIDPYC